MLWKLVHRVHADGRLRGHPCVERDHGAAVGADASTAPADSGSTLARIWLFVRIAAWIISFHLLEIGVWATFYWWDGALPDLPTSIYFSAVTYTTTGYGDVVLPADWRLVGGVEALTGILMCGWSTGFFFASRRTGSKR